MKISKLDISGFKSFVERTVLNFDNDVTCIVGPNGCGKSNIVDAIRWVMGVQSAKQLRGKAMEDVIFNGAESRGPLSFAEVSLTFNNSDRLAPVEYNDYSEITVTRRLDRSGNSDYFINKTPVRLKDVTELFLGTGVGREAYSIVEQGRIGLIVSAKAEDRRQLIEEAAGITKFKARKRSSEIKMNHTRQNLLRVSDIIEEIGKTLASLKRQARKAERYKAYRQEIRDLELWVASHRWLELTGSHTVLQKEIEKASAEIDGMRIALRVREAETEAERSALAEIEKKVERAQTRAYELNNAVKLLESEIAHHRDQLPALKDLETGARRELDESAKRREELKMESEAMASRLKGLVETEQAEARALDSENQELERRRQSAEEAEQALTATREQVAEADTRIAKAEVALASFDERREQTRARVDKLSREREALVSRTTELRQESGELQARCEGLVGGQDLLASRRDQIEAELQQTRDEIEASDVRVKQLQVDLANKRSRLGSLKEIQQRFEGVGTGVRAVMTGFARDIRDGEIERVWGLLADRFECPPEFTAALAAALGEKLHYVVVDCLDTSVQAIQYLHKGRRGRATLIPRVPKCDPPEHKDKPTDAGVVGYLIDLIEVTDEDRQLAEHMLGDVLVVENLDIARERHARALDRGPIVTLAGEVLSSDGALCGGDGEDAGAHLIEVKREIRNLEEEVERLEAATHEAVEKHGELRKAIAQHQAALDTTRSDAHEKEIALVAANRDIKRAEEAESEVCKRIEAIAAELDDLTRRLEQTDQEEAETHAEREAAQVAEMAARADVNAAEEIYRMGRSAVEEQNAVVMEVRVRAAQAKQQAEDDRAALARLQRQIEELGDRDQRLQNDVAQFAAEQIELTERMEKDRTLLDARIAEAMQAEQVQSDRRAEYDQARDVLNQNELRLRELRLVIEQSTGAINERVVKEREIAMETEHLVSGTMQRHRVLVPKVLTDYHAREMPDENVLSRIEDLLRVVERMGEINLTAIDEYEERSERHQKLTEQKKDLESALTQLETAIRRMNRESRRLFRETFHEVNKLFQKMFPVMFGGGKAELRLTDPEDLLESGIDIVAMPPGKKLGMIELMSGGEKALTAISLILALFQYKPTPFCLLDEVDAPLDEANIGRFCEIVKEMTSRSQFIIITHSRQTVMIADVLYGITMETPGISKIVSVQLGQGNEDKPLPHLDNSAAVA